MSPADPSPALLDSNRECNQADKASLMTRQLKVEDMWRLMQHVVDKFYVDKKWNVTLILIQYLK